MRLYWKTLGVLESIDKLSIFNCSQKSLGTYIQRLQRVLSDGIVQRNQEGDEDGERWKDKLGKISGLKGLWRRG
jgi:hypothetical protein